MRSRLLIAMLAVLLLVAVAGCPRQGESPTAGPAVSSPPVGAAGQAVDDGEKLFNTKCTRCHTLQRVEKHDPDKEPWPELVKDMQGIEAGWISDDEAKAITEHLQKAFPTE